MNTFFTLSENANMNYIATICKITELHPIPKADRLLRTVVNGFDIVVSNDMKEGDIVVYFPVESEICEKFLSANNLYRIEDYEKNMNSLEVKDIYMKYLSADNEADKAEYMKQCKEHCGFFTSKGRVKCMNLRDCPSQGFIIPVSSLVKYNKKLGEIKDWEPYVGTEFNKVDGEDFCWKYVVPIKTGTPRSNHMKKAQKRLKRFDRIIPEQFEFHYETKMLNVNMWRFTPDTNVNISVKVHGTSVILANVLCNRELSFWEKVKKFFGAKVADKEYGNIVSSRKVIKNRDINPNAKDYYSGDVYSAANEVFGKYIPEGMTVYGEIVGYVPGSESMVQKNHDYGCKVGEWKLMPYRITETTPNGEKTEWDLMKVDAWTKELVRDHPEVESNVMFLNILYTGRFGDLYPDISEDEHWADNVLEALKAEDRFLMEKDEPMCLLHRDEVSLIEEKLNIAKSDGKASKKDIKMLEKTLKLAVESLAPREGIVVKITDDPIGEAWKLKTQAHYQLEKKQHDNGEVDMEEAESEGSENNN